MNKITRLTPCSYYPDYKGTREPTCGCAPCWEKWVDSLEEWIKNLEEYKWMYEDLCK